MDATVAGAAALALVSKWGEKVFLSDERVKRSVYAGNEMARTFQKAINTVVNKVEQLSIATIGSTVTNTSAAAAAWSNASALIFRDIEKAAATVVDQNQGYNPDTVLMSSTKYAMAVSDQIIASLRRRETTDNPVYGGDPTENGHFYVLYTAVADLPAHGVWVADPTKPRRMGRESN